MINNSIKTSLRNIIKQKSHTVINILGLSLGLAISLLIWVYVLQELNYDNFYDDYKQIFRVHSTVSTGTGQPQTIPTAMFKLSELAMAEIPEIENYVRFNNFYGTSSVTYLDKKVYMKDIMLTDSTFFSIFNLPFITGDAASSLKEANSLVLTKSSAMLLFENPEEAFGKMVTFNGNTYQITGVIQDIPQNTHLDISGLVPHYDLASGVKDNGYNWYTYYKLKPGANLESVAEQLDKMALEKIIAVHPILKDFNVKQVSHLMNISDIHLRSNLVWEMKTNGNRQTLAVFIILSLFILVVAVINFVNLATARSMLRSKEIGVRKVVGASKLGLIRQFMTESLVITVLAFFIAMAITEIASGYFSQQLGLAINTSILFSLQGLAVLILIIGFTALLSGLYPAFYLASFDPIKTLKGEQVKGRKGQGFRRILVVFQFSVTIMLLISLWVVASQLRFMQKQNMGFDKEQIIVVKDLSPRISQSFATTCQQLETQNRIMKTAGANFLFGGNNRIDIILEEGVSKESGVKADIVSIDQHFLELLDIPLIEGRNFFANSQQDAQSAFLLNETAVQAMGFTDPLGKRLDLFGRTGPLVGIVKDFHIKSFHSPIEPLVIIYAQNGFSNLYIKVSPGDMQQARQQISAVLNDIDPAYMPDMIFLDEMVQAFYEKEKTTTGLLSVGAVLAIIIALLGVYGLAAFSAERRTKEIGVRRVLGASVKNLLWVFTRESIALTAIAFIIATPLSWYIIDGWLDNFLLRVSINPLWFVIPGMMVFLMSTIIISIQIWMTTKSNPVKSLRTE